MKEKGSETRKEKKQISGSGCPDGHSFRTQSHLVSHRGRSPGILCRNTAPQDNPSEEENKRNLSIGFLHWSKFTPWGFNSHALPGCVPGPSGQQLRKPDVMSPRMTL